jgi:cytochrome P450
MEDTSHYFLGWALVALALLATFRWGLRANYGLRLPPGPWQLPVIGSLHHLVGQLPHRALRDLAKRHGPVMLLRLGEVPTLVLSSSDAAREVMKTHDVAFSSRPLTATMSVVTCGGRDIIFSPYGEYWRHLRKIAVTELLSASRVLSFRAIREEEVAGMLRDVESAAAAGGAVEMRARLCGVVSDITFRAVMGDRCKQRDLFLRELDTLVGLTTGFNPVDLWPSSWLAGRLSGALRRAEENHALVYGIIKDVIQEHLHRNKGREEEAEDLLDVLLKIQKDGGVDMVAIEAVIFVHIDCYFFILCHFFQYTYSTKTNT